MNKPTPEQTDRARKLVMTNLCDVPPGLQELMINVIAQALADEAEVDMRKGMAAAVADVVGLRKALELILPLAKGYAAAHKVASSDVYIRAAESALAGESDK